MSSRVRPRNGARADRCDLQRRRRRGGDTNATIALLESIAGRELDVRREEAVAGDQRRTMADTTRIRAELGWQPETALATGLRAQWEWAASEREIESPA